MKDRRSEERIVRDRARLYILNELRDWAKAGSSNSWKTDEGREAIHLLCDGSLGDGDGAEADYFWLKDFRETLVVESKRLTKILSEAWPKEDRERRKRKPK